MSETNRRVIVRFDMLSPLLKLRYMKKRRYTYAEVGERIGLHENTVQRMASGKTSGIEFDVLTRLVNFFRAEGWTDFDVKDLFVTEQEQAA